MPSEIAAPKKKSAVSDEAMPLGKVVLQVRDLETSFGHSVIHSGFNLDVHAGEVLVLLGGSGAGKSTFLRCLVGLERPSAGSCLFEGEDLFQLDERGWCARRQRIAYAFQGGALFDSLTVAENLSYPLREHTRLGETEIAEKVRDMLVRFGMQGCEGLLPASLSGGMQKRIGLARAIMSDPAVILYDEPTAGLDPANSRKIATLIRSLRDAGKTSVLVTHDTVTALQVADRIAFIHGGRIAVTQTRAEVAASPHPRIAAYLEGEELP